MNMSLLLYIFIFHSVCFAVSTQLDTKDDIRELASRMALLEHTFVQEHHRDDGPTHPLISYGFIKRKEGNTIRDLQHRLQLLEDKLFQDETHFGETKHCNNRIQTLENTVQELANLVKKQTHYAKSSEQLEKMLTDRQNTGSKLRDEKLQKKKSATLFFDENDTKQDENTNIDETSMASDNKTRIARFIRSTYSERDLRESNIMKSKIFLHYTITFLLWRLQTFVS